MTKQKLLLGAKNWRCIVYVEKAFLVHHSFSGDAPEPCMLRFSCGAVRSVYWRQHRQRFNLSDYQVDAQTRTGIKSISVSGTLYEKGTFGTWQRVSNCLNTSTTSNCMASGNYNTKPGKSYKLEYSATFNYSDGRSETITGSTSR